MGRHPVPSSSIVAAHFRNELNDRLREYQNPVDWMALSKALHAAHGSLSSKFPHLDAGEVLDLLIRDLNQQIRNDYTYGPKDLVKRFGWVRRKRRNAV